MEESTTLCSNCQRPIAASNFVTHSVHCQRNLTKCEKCGEAVPRSALEEHEAEFHVKVNCPDCRMSVEKPLLESHKKTSCRSRQQGCPFCELELPASEMYEHKNYCGSRTKKCEDCGEYVMLKYEQLHLESNHGFLKLDDEPGPTATWIKNDLESGSSRPAKSNNNNKKPQLNTGKFDNSDDDDVEDIPNLFANLMKKKKVVSTFPHYPGVAYPLSGGPQRVVSRSPPPYQDVPDESSDLVALPCEFCEAMIPVNQLILHQTACRMDITSFGKQTRKVESGILKPNFAAFRNDDKDNDVGVEDNNLESTAYDDVLDWRREEKPELFDIRRNAIDEGTVEVRRNDITETYYDAFKNTGDDTEAAFRQDLDDVDVYLPCEFCGDGYPPSLLLEHQNVCEYHPKNVPEGASPAWSDPQEGAAGRPTGVLDALRARKFDVKDSDQHHSNGKHSLSPPYKGVKVELSEVPFVPESPRSPTGHEVVYTNQTSQSDISPRARQPFLVQSTCQTSKTGDKHHPSICRGLKLDQSRLDTKHCETRSDRNGLHESVRNSTATQCVRKSGDLCLSSFYQSKPGSNLAKVNVVAHASGGLDIPSDAKKECFPVQAFSTCIEKKRTRVQGSTAIPIVAFPPHEVSSCHPLCQSGASDTVASETLVSFPICARGKSNIDSYNDLRGNFTVASEWSDDSDSRPTSATGAIPKQKAGKLNLSRKINQEVQGSRSTNTVRPSSSRPVNQHTQRIHIRNNLKDDDDDDEDDENN